jgi:ribosomal protein S18 acetylase RimI-like enzyme
MYIRTYVSTDLPALIDLTVETFRPFYESYIHPLLGDEVFQHQHGAWDQDYRDEIPTLHDPELRRFVAVAQIDGTIVGYVSWKVEGRPHHGVIHLLAVASSARRQQIGFNLCRHAMEQMKADGVKVVEVGTGDDAFHAAARGHYEELGFTKIPAAAYLMKI